MSSSTDKTNLLGPIPSRFHSQAPRVRTRATASSVGGSTSLSLKPAARNSLELINIATGGRDVPVWFVTNHAWHRVAFTLMVCRFGLLNEVTVGGEVFECCFCFVQRFYHGSLTLLPQVIYTIPLNPSQAYSRHIWSQLARMRIENECFTDRLSHTTMETTQSALTEEVGWLCVLKRWCTHKLGSFPVSTWLLRHTEIQKSCSLSKFVMQGSSSGHASSASCLADGLNNRAMICDTTPMVSL